MEMGELWANFF